MNGWLYNASLVKQQNGYHVIPFFLLLDSLFTFVRQRVHYINKHWTTVLRIKINKFSKFIFGNSE